MGWPAFFRIVSGAAIFILVGVILALKKGPDVDNFTASYVGPREIIINEAVAFVGLVFLAFLVFWTRSVIRWLFIRVGRLFRWLFSWRMIRRYLYGLASFAFLVGLFYAEENWRGKRDWEQCKRSAAAKSERFDLSSFELSTVPDDENFAFAPIVSNSCLHAYDGYTPETELRNPNGERLLDVRINARPDWKPWPTNDFQGNWQCGKVVDLKVFQAYYRAAANSNWRTNEYANVHRMRGGLFPRRLQASLPDKIPPQVATNEFPVAQQPQSPAADVLLALSKYDSALDELRQASLRPFFRFPLRQRPDSTNGSSPPDLTPFRECMGVLRLRAVAELENNQSEKALADVTLMLFIANLNRHEPWRELWRQRWRINGINSALQPVWQGLVGHRWSDAQLDAIEEELAQFDFLADYQYLVRSWRAETLEEINSMEQERFHNFWAQLYFGSDLDDRSLWQRIFDMDTLLAFMPKGWFYENKVAVARLSEESLRTDAEVKQKILSAGVATRFEEAMASNHQHRGLRDFAIEIMYSGFAREAQTFAFTQSSLDRARVACALERYRLAEGEYPATLDELAPRFIKNVPNDIINDRPLHYRRANGHFLLYSVGWNGVDDGGVVAYSKDWFYATLDKGRGDWVWFSPGD
jgi:hypothetical protein